MVIVKIKRRDHRGSYWQIYEAPRLGKGFTVLDLLIYIKERIDPSLGVPYSCRMGLCGACSMKINGRPRLACQTPIDEALVNGEMTIEPIDERRVIKDLIVSL